MNSLNPNGFAAHQLDFSLMLPTTPLPVVALANWYQFAARERVRYPQVESRMLLWCKAGRGRVTVNGRPLDMASADYAVLPWGHRIAYEPHPRSPFQLGGIHLIPHHDPKHAVEFAVAHLPSHPLAGRRWRRDAALPGFDDVVRGTFAAHPALEHLAEYVVTRYTLDRERDEGEMRALAQLIVAEITRPQGIQPSVDGPAALHRMMQWVRTHLEEPVDIEALAKVGGCSVATARRMFRRHLGVAPLTWVSRVKVDGAEHLLRTTSLPMSQVAERVGIADAFYFSRWFRRHRGYSPRESRRRDARL